MFSAAAAAAVVILADKNNIGGVICIVIWVVAVDFFPECQRCFSCDFASGWCDFSIFCSFCFIIILPEGSNMPICNLSMCIHRFKHEQAFSFSLSLFLSRSFSLSLSQRLSLVISHSLILAQSLGQPLFLYLSPNHCHILSLPESLSHSIFFTVPLSISISQSFSLPLSFNPSLCQSVCLSVCLLHSLCLNFS